MEEWKCWRDETNGVKGVVGWGMIEWSAKGEFRQVERWSVGV